MPESVPASPYVSCVLSLTFISRFAVNRSRHGLQGKPRPIHFPTTFPRRVPPSSQVLGSIAGNRFDSLERISRVSAPILVAHGDQDEIVPFELGERLFAAAPEPKRFFRVSGADHNDALERAVLLDAIAEFAREAVAGRRRGG